MKIKVTLAVALVAVAGLGAYGTYQDYKSDEESNLVMLNVEAMTGDDVNSGSYTLWKNYHVHKYSMSNGVIVKTDSVKGVSQGVLIENETQLKKAQKQGYVFYYSHSHKYRICKNTSIPDIDSE